ncbi:MAG TPA: tRNA pseudouridine(55) synthase TruB [Bacteroidales bacterium]|jgi:tRNA pseudouridine55 synthase|nr:tRNA pseudouridine(55) synthase TruB [Bacteroidales bacterium]
MEERSPSIFETGQVLTFNKPLYWTSFDLVNKVRIMIRSNLGIKKIKVGHAGTLDPLASGLMIICTGRSTKRIEEFRDLDKEYVATFHLGATTPSFDLETETDNIYPFDHITEELVRSALMSFIGEQKQLPPVYSAKLVDGKRAYEFARKGQHTELNPVPVIFHELELLSYDLPEVTIRLRCSKGTYIRSFARDLGLALGSGAYLSALERTAIGHFKVKEAHTLETFQEYVEKVKAS